MNVKPFRHVTCIAFQMVQVLCLLKPAFCTCALPRMAVSSFTAATRALVSVLLVLARSYLVVWEVNRDSPTEQVLKAYRKVLLKVHPDKGGKKADTQKLQEVKEAWDKARKGSAGKTDSTTGAVAVRAAQRKEYRVNAQVVLLTYQGVAGLGQWHRFVAWARGSLKKFGVQRWGATLEACETDGLHTHLVFQFKAKVDKTAKSFAFEGITPNVRTGDYLGEGLNCKRHQLSVNRGLFYVFADKVGTQREADGRPCWEGNHVPVWVAARKEQSRYTVVGKWCENLWKARKLDHSTYEEYLYLSRDGVQSRKRNLDEVRGWEERREEKKEREAVTKKVRATLFKPFEEVPAAVAFLSLFDQELDRYPFLVVLAPSRAGKTEWAKSLFKDPLVLGVGQLEHFPDGMRRFSRKLHDGNVLDDLRDFFFCVRHQEKLQGKVDTETEFAATPSGQYAFSKWLWRVPVVVTANYTTANRDLLETNDFLGNSDNRVVVERRANTEHLF